MPIKIPNDLPARVVLDRERVPVITEDVALRKDIRPLQIALLNLMPDKIKTETQLLRVLGATPLQIEMTLLRPGSHESRNTPQEHLTAFYKTWQEVRDRRFDALIVTGAPVEHLAFERQMLDRRAGNDQRIEASVSHLLPCLVESGQMLLRRVL